MLVKQTLDNFARIVADAREGLTTPTAALSFLSRDRDEALAALANQYKTDGFRRVQEKATAVGQLPTTFDNLLSVLRKELGEMGNKEKVESLTKRIYALYLDNNGDHAQIEEAFLNATDALVAHARRSRANA